VAVDTTVGVVGLKDALKTLNKVAPTLRRQITKDYQKIVEPMLVQARSMTPTIGPVSGMDRTGWRTRSGVEVLPQAGWNGVKAQKAFKAKISTRRVKEFRGTMENVGTFRLVWTGWANTVFDMAGRKSAGSSDVFSRMGSHGRMVGAVGGPRLLAMLQGRYGGASRLVYPAYEREKTAVDNEMQQLVERVMREVQNELNKPPGA
jgi:hypothetical protein